MTALADDAQALDLEQLSRMVSILEHAGPNLTRVDLALRSIVPSLIAVAQAARAWEAIQAEMGAEFASEEASHLGDALAALDAKLAEWKS